MEWLNEPASWQRTDDVLQVNVDPGTDFWRVTGYGYIRDSGHVYGEVLAGDLDVAVRIRGNWSAQYDQAGVMLRADERTWLKTGIEFFEGRPRLSTVLTLGMSSWTVANLPDDTNDVALRLSRRGDAVEIRYSTGDSAPDLAALVYLPPDAELLAGVMCAARKGRGSACPSMSCGSPSASSRMGRVSGIPAGAPRGRGPFPAQISAGRRAPAPRRLPRRLTRPDLRA